MVLLEQLLAPVPGGTGRYSRELTRALAATAPTGWTVGSAIARHADPTAAVLPGVEGPTVLPLPRRALIAAWESGVPLWPGGDTVHAPTPLAPPGPRRGRGLVVTVHDTVPWTHPETLTRRGARWHRRVIGRAARRAGALVVPTAAVAAELPRYLPHPARMGVVGRMHVVGRIHVVGEGVTPEVTTAPEPRCADEIAARLDLPPRYVLAIGTLEPRKGIDVLLDALASPGGPDVSLVLVGQRGWGGVDPRPRRGGSGSHRAGCACWAGSPTPSLPWCCIAPPCWPRRAGRRASGCRCSKRWRPGCRWCTPTWRRWSRSPAAPGCPWRATIRPGWPPRCGPCSPTPARRKR